MSSGLFFIDVLRRRERVTSAWLSHLDAPYVWGTMDCSHLVWSGHSAVGSWPIDGEGGYRTAGQMWVMPELVTVAWDERQSGDLVFFGENGLCHHVVGVLDSMTLIGANSGGPPLDGESMQAYIAREFAAGAKVKKVQFNYWQSHRLGIRRVPSLYLPQQGPPAPAA